MPPLYSLCENASAPIFRRFGCKLVRRSPADGEKRHRPRNASATTRRPSGRLARPRLPASGRGGPLPRPELGLPLEEQDRPRSDTQFGSAPGLQILSSAPPLSAVAAADQSQPGRWSASYRPRGGLSRQTGFALPAEGPACFKLTWGGNAPSPGSRRVGKSAEADGWPPPAVGAPSSAMLSAGRICRHHARRKRSTPVPALAAAGRRGRFAPALSHISGAPPVPTAVRCSGPAAGTPNRCLRCR